MFWAALILSASQPAPQPGDGPDAAGVMRISLPVALQLAQVRPIDIIVAGRRIEVAQAQFEKARVLWLPDLVVGFDYLRSDGKIQRIEGEIINASKGAIMAGAGPVAVFGLTDAIYAPLAARQVVRGKAAELQATLNDTMFQVADSYYSLQQARGELAGALDTLERIRELERRVVKLAPGLVPDVEASRVRAERVRREQEVERAKERWEVASAGLGAVLRLDDVALLSPVELPHLVVDLVDMDQPVEALRGMARGMRPELGAQAAGVEASSARLKQEKARPFIPSILLRGAATHPGGTLAGGVFGGGINGDMGDFGGRNSIDLQILWEMKNLGAGNVALIRERRAQREVAEQELVKTRYQVDAEVLQARSRGLRSRARYLQAELGLREARASADKNLQGVGQLRRNGEMVSLMFRPQEAVQSLQALSNAYNDFYLAVAERNRAQFQMYRALGNPAQALDPPAETEPDRPEALPRPAPLVP